jgi:hypothetical protein
MKPMWKATLAFLVMIMLLAGGGLIAGKYIFAPWERILSESTPAVVSGAKSSDGGLSDKEYKKLRLAFNAFDLAAGLTKNDLETMPICNTYYFAFAWLCIGLVFLLRKSRKGHSD